MIPKVYNMTALDFTKKVLIKNSIIYSIGDLLIFFQMHTDAGVSSPKIGLLVLFYSLIFRNDSNNHIPC